MMTARQISLVKQSFRSIEPVIDDAAILFYERLFEIDRSVPRLFRKSPREEARLLAETLPGIVNAIDHPAQLRVAAEVLGPRCAGCGVRDRHYEAVGQALLWTLANGLHDTFTPEVRDAWMAAYGRLAFSVQRAAARCRVDVQIEGSAQLTHEVDARC